MIDEDRTMQLFGYTSDELIPQSNKCVVGVCELCGDYEVVEMQNYRTLCGDCAHGIPPTTNVNSGVYIWAGE